MTSSTDHIVVVGAGMGGLASAIRLAHAGLRVTVLEAHSAPGGKMRTVPSPAGPIDAGPTVLTMRDVFEDLFRSVGETLGDHVRLEREPLLARHWWPDGSTLDLFDDEDASAEAIGALAGPAARDQFRVFNERAARLFSGFETPVMQSPAPSFAGLMAHVLPRPRLARDMGGAATMAQSLARSFDDPRLRQLFGRYATYVGGSPYRSPAVLQLIWNSEFRGVWRVHGGMHRLACAMAELAARRGAEFRYGARARRIETQAGRIVAVHTDDERVACDTVVFNGDPRALAAGALGPSATAAVPRRAVEPRSLSANVWTFAAEPRGVDLAHHNVFFGADPRTEFDPISAGNLPEDPTLYVCAQDRGGGRTPSGRERFEIIMNAPPWSGGTEDRSSCRTRTFPVLAHRGLRFSPEPDDTALTTPQDFNAMFPESQGSLYGRSPHGLTAAFARPTARTALKGLYLAGGGAHPGAGVPMAALSGRHAAAAILTDHASISTSRPTATRGGMSMASRIAGALPSRSSPS